MSERYDKLGSTGPQLLGTSWTQLYLWEWFSWTLNLALFGRYWVGKVCQHLFLSHPPSLFFWDLVLVLVGPFCRGVGYDPVWLHMADCPGVVAVWPPQPPTPDSASSRAIGIMYCQVSFWHNPFPYPFFPPSTGSSVSSPRGIMSKDHFKQLSAWNDW